MGRGASRRPSNGWRKAWPITPIRTRSRFTRYNGSLSPPAWRQRSSTICVPPRSLGWPNRCTAASTTCILGQDAPWPTPRWRKCVRRLTPEFLPRRSARESSYHSARHSSQDDCRLTTFDSIKLVAGKLAQVYD